MMTEKEAKAKWCCRSMGIDSSDKCIAAMCMAWRWASQSPPAADEYRQGYCGFAGKPE